MPLNELSELDVTRMYALLRLGMSQKNVAKIFKLTPAAVSNRITRAQKKGIRTSWTMRELEAVLVAHRDEWREVPMFRGILWAHPSGQIRTARKVLKQNLNGWDYAHIVLEKGTVKRTLRVHKLIAETFLGPCPKGHEVHHKDANRANPALANLKYVTHAENVQHSIISGAHYSVRQSTGSRKPKMSEAEIKDMALDRLAGMPWHAVATKFGRSIGHVMHIVKAVTVRKLHNLPEVK